ncbi:hypothetical protein KIN20_036957, partial [Parelaphostrongylus tenuis]
MNKRSDDKNNDDHLPRKKPGGSRTIPGLRLDIARPNSGPSKCRRLPNVTRPAETRKQEKEQDLKIRPR